MDSPESNSETSSRAQQLLTVADTLETLAGLNERSQTSFLADQRQFGNVLEDVLSWVLETSFDEDTEAASDADLTSPRARSTGIHAVLPERIDSYEIKSLLGSGGMSSVYLAERADSQFHRTVAIKVIRVGSDNPSIRRRFRSERQILAGFDHPNIAKLYGGGTTPEGLPYLVLEHIEGLPIDQYCEQHELSVTERLQLVRKVCAAVQYAHRRLVIHRDIKPSNILVNDDGEPRLLDFGIAKVLAPEAFPITIAPTRAGQVPMTPQYASPEQLNGEAVTTVSDVYSLGVLLFKLLTTRLPRLSTQSGITKPEIVKPSQALSDQPSTHQPSKAAKRGLSSAGIQRLRKTLRGDLDTIAAVALRQDPERRYASAEQLSEDIRRYLTGLPIEARKDTLFYRFGKLVQRHRWGTLVSALAVALILGLVAALSLNNASLAKQRSAALKAQSEAETANTQAQKTSEFLTSLFRDANPLKPGEPLSAQDLLNSGVERLRTELIDQPLVRAGLLSELGVLYAEVSDIETAEKLLLEAVGQFEQGDFGSTRHKAALMRLVKAYGKQPHQQHESLAAAQRYQEILLQTQESTEAEWIDVLDTVGSAELALGQVEQGFANRREALRRARELGEPGLTARMVNNLGVALAEHQRVAEAQPLFQESADFQLKKNGPDHPITLTFLQNTALTYKDLGHFEEAIRRFRNLIPRFREAFDRYPAAARPANALAGLLMEQGRLDEALQVLEPWIDPAGEDRIDAFLQQSLGHVLRRRDDFSKSETAFRKALAINEKFFGQNSEPVSAALLDLGNLFLPQGRVNEAEQFLNQAIEIAHSLGGQGLQTRASAFSSLARLQIQQGQLEQAELTLQSLKAEGKTSEIQLATRLRLARNLAEVYLRTGRLDQAVNEIDEIRSLQEQDLALSKADHAESAVLFAEIHTATQQLAQARADCKEVEDLLGDRLDRSTLRIRGLLKRLAAVENQLGPR